jgi:hypothetical protein
MRITVPRSGVAQAALGLLLVNAFGSLVVGLTLLAGRVGSWLTWVSLAWGVASLVGAYGVWRIRPWAPFVIVPAQGAVAVGLLAVFVAYARDWSVLLVAALAAGAALFAAVDAVRRRRS